MSMDWQNRILRMALAKQELHDVDKENLWPWELPNVAATEEDLLTIERKLGLKIDFNYRDFLKFANGWKGFFQDTDLFGTLELSGIANNLRVTSLLAGIEESLKHSGIPKNEILPIGVSRNSIDLFVIARSDSNQDGVVIWFAGDEIDRFSSFVDFFVAMTDHIIEEIEDIKAETV